MLEGRYPLLFVHSLVGMMLVISALGAPFLRPLRRITLYVLGVQIVLGAVVWYTTKLEPPVLHWFLALIAGGAYSAANAMERKGRPKAVVRAILAVGALIVLIAAGLGSSAAHGLN